MKLSVREYTLELRHTFTIARGSVETKRVVIVRLEHDGIVGYGESAPTSRYGETIDTVTAFFGKIDPERFDNPLQLEAILAYIDTISEGNYSAKAAIDLALHDWMGEKAGDSSL